VGPRAGLDAVVRRKIPIPHRDSNPTIIQLVDQRRVGRREEMRVCGETELREAYKNCI
jgi:hypothetical protein